MKQAAGSKGSGVDCGNDFPFGLTSTAIDHRPRLGGLWDRAGVMVPDRRLLFSRLFFFVFSPVLVVIIVVPVLVVVLIVIEVVVVFVIVFFV